MKKEFAGLFFYMLYMIAMMRPVMPVLEYYANYEYIATTLCENRDKPALACNGKCYLQKELTKVNQPVSHKNHQHEGTIPQIDLSKYPVAPIANSSSVVFQIKTNSCSNWKTPEGNPKQEITTVFRPPLFVV